MSNAITEFQGEYRWLSNFWRCYVALDGAVYRSVEHAYMSAKSDDPAWKAYCAAASKPADVKRASHAITLRPGWDQEKDTVMLACVRSKFTDPTLARLLLATGDMLIQEGNRWGDTYWGVDLRRVPPVGQNKLGDIIAHVRSELRGR